MDGNAPDQAPVTQLSDRDGMIERERRKRLFYVWSVVFLAVFLASILIWPLTVKTFKMTSRCHVTVPAADASYEQNEIAAYEIVRKITGDDALQLVTDKIEKSVKLENRFLKDRDWDALRETVKVSVQNGATDSDVIVQLSIEGRGTTDEKRLINQLVSLFAVEFARDSRVSDVQSQFKALKQQADLDDRNNSEDLNAQINALRGVLNSTEQKFRALASEFANQDQQHPTLNQPVSNSGNETQIARLRDQQRGLMIERFEKESRNNWSIEHPEIAQIQRKIDDIQTQIRNLESAGLNGRNQSLSTNSAQFEAHKTNHFALASATSKTESTLAGFASQLETIDLNSARSALDQLNDMIRTDATQRQQLLSSFNDQFAQTTSIGVASLTINDIALADKVYAIGASPHVVQLMFLAFLGLAVASVVTWKFDPSAVTKPFETSEKLQHVLGIPVLATIATRANANSKGNGVLHTWATRLVRTSEAVLLLLLIGLIAACLIDNQFIFTFFSNPLNAIARLFAG